MQDQDLQQLSSRIERRTDRILMASGAMFLIWQVAYFIIFDRRGAPIRSVDIVASIGFAAWAGALLMLLATGGGAFRRKDVREILDDELARSQRARAYQNAFWAVMLVALCGYIAAHFIEFTARLLGHVTLSAGVLVSVMTLAYQRRQ